MRQSRLTQNNVQRSHSKKKIPWIRTITLTLVAVGVGFLGYGGYKIYVASGNTQHIMKQSKGIKEVYGQGAKGQKEHANRSEFDKLYYKYMKADDSTLVKTNKGIPKGISIKLTSLAKQTGDYYIDSYTDKAKEFALISSIQNDYISLWKKNHVNEVFAKSTRPSTVYLFNANHYNDLQTILAINANSQYPIWMITQMQGIGNDAIKVEGLVQAVSQYFTFPTLTKSWYVTHDYTSTVQSGLIADYDGLGYKWSILSFLPSLLDASSAAGVKNETMQQKVNEANDKIESIKAASIASSQAKAESESIASSEKAALESSAKASSEAASSSKAAAQSSSSKSSSSSSSNNDDNGQSSSSDNNNDNSSSSDSSSTDDMPNYVGRSVDIAVAWARQHNVRLMTQVIRTGSYSDNEIISQDKRGDTYYVSYYQAN